MKRSPKKSPVSKAVSKADAARERDLRLIEKTLDAFKAAIRRNFVHVPSARVPRSVEEKAAYAWSFLHGAITSEFLKRLGVAAAAHRTIDFTAAMLDALGASKKPDVEVRKSLVN